MSGALQAVYMNQRSFVLPPYFFGRYGATNINQNNNITGVAADSSKSTLFCGTQSAPSALSVLFKIDSSKTVVFQLQHSQSTNTVSHTSVAVDSSNNIYCAGYIATSIYSSLLTKLNSSGTLQWSRTLSSSVGIAFATRTGTDSSNNAYIAGYGKTDLSDPNEKYYIWVAKYDTSGTLQWQRKLYQSTGNNILADFSVDSSGNNYVTGYSTQSGTQYGYVAKYNSSGTLQWQRQFVGTSYGSGGCVIADSSGNVYVGGNASPSGLLIKFNSSGSVLWQRSFTNTYFQMIGVDSSGNVYTGGEGPTYQGQIVKYNSSGSIQWQRNINATLTGQNFKYWWGMGIDSDGNLNVSGITGQAAGGASNNLGMIARFPNDGAFTGTYTVGGTAYTISAGTQTDAAGSATISTASLTDSAGIFSGASTTLTQATNTTPIALVNVP